MSRPLFLLLSAIAALRPESEPLQDSNGAEAQFRALEKRLLDADSVSVEIDIETFFNAQPPTQLKLNAAWQRDNRLKYSIDLAVGATTVTQTAVSDGKQLRVTGEGKPERRAARADLFRILSGSLSRAGAVATIPIVIEGDRPDQPFDERYKVSGFELGKKEKTGDRETQEIFYNVELPRGKAKGTLWIDLATGLPVKRVLVLTAKKEVTRYLETISKLRFNDKLDPKMFDLPPKDE